MSLGAAALGAEVTAEMTAAVAMEASKASVCSKFETRHEGKTKRQQQWRKNTGL